MKRTLIIAIGLLLLGACKNESTDPVDRPYTPPQTEEPDISAELANPARRIVLTDTTIHYDTGGIIFGRSRQGEFFAIDIANGWRADYNPGDITLKVNGAEIPVENPTVAKKEGNTQWLVLTPKSDPNKRIIIVEKP